MARLSQSDRGLWIVAVLALTAALGLQAQAFGQSVTFNPSDSVPSEPEFLVNLDIDCLTESVKGVEVKVVYDPFLVRLDAITPGEWFTGSGQAFYFFDYTNTDPQGTIHFASAVLDGALGGSGRLAVCHFTIRDFGISPLVFQDVDVRGLANQELGFGHSTGDRITVDPVVDLKVQTFGHLKAIYR